MLAGVASCTQPLEPPTRDLESPIQTDALEYEVERYDLGAYGGHGFRGEIPHQLTNHTGDTLFDVAGCGATCAILEKKTPEGWVGAWGAFVLGPTGGPPRVLPPGESHADTLRILAYPVGSGLFPEFQAEGIDGIYRIRWTTLRRDYESLREQGAEVEQSHSVSNPFLLREIRDNE